MLQPAKHIGTSRWSPWVVALSAWLATGCLLLPNLAGASLTLEGRLDAQLVRWLDGSDQPSPKAHAVTKFRIVVAGSRWLLRSEYAPDWFWLVGYDRTNTYSELVTAGCAAYPPPCSGMVFSGAFPVFNDYNVTVPWLAFCSLDFIDNLRTEPTVPILGYATMLDPFAHICVSRIERSHAPPYLPDRVTWVTASNRLWAAGTDPMLRVEGQTPNEVAAKRVNYIKSIPPGIVLADYRVTAWTNVHDLAIPIAFEYRGFNYANAEQKSVFQAVRQAAHKTNSLVPATFTNDTWLDGYYRGIVTSAVQWSDQDVELPELQTPTQIQDYRLSDRGKGIDYVMYTTSEWKRGVDKMLLRLLKAKQKHPPGVARDTTAIRVLILIALAALFLMPVVVTLIARHRKNGTIDPAKIQMG